MAYSALKNVNKLLPNVRNMCLFEDQVKTAGILVIGDEILKGEVIDTNSSYMTRKLHNIGVKVKKISVIGDSVEEISDEVKIFAYKFDYVITTGGIGPTHDDVTFEAVAKAFNEPLKLHPHLYELCSQYFKTTNPDSPGMKLAKVPKSAYLTYGEDKITKSRVKYPSIAVRNVFMLPGIPQLLENSFELLCEQHFKSNCKFYTKAIYVNVTEDKIVKILDNLVKEFPNVVFGSYPKLFDSAYKVKITIESTEEKSTIEAYNKLLQMVPDGCIVNC